MKSLILLQEKVKEAIGSTATNCSSSASAKLAFNATEEKVFITSLVGEGNDECQIMTYKEGTSNFDLLVNFPVPSGGQDLYIVLSKYLMDSDTLCLCFSNGDIVLVPFMNPEQIDNVGSVESGLLSVVWSPDEEIFAAYTGEKKLLIMTKDFDVLSENFVHVDEKGEEYYANVGWGKKETQFHGSAGKLAAQVQSPTKFHLSPDDDLKPRISWRGDGSYLVCSAVDPINEKRVLRVYDREGVLQNTSEPVDQLEHPLAWRPSGNLIASTQRLPHRHQTVFFERNGLRHGEFTLPADIHKVLEMRWNCDSSLLVLSVLKKTEGGNLPFLQLWNMNNYFWYMKYELPISKSESVLLSEASFDPENPLRLSLILSDGTYKAFEFGWINYVSESTSSSSASLAAVVHGPSLFLTPFRFRNIPPPLSGYQIPADHPILHVAFSGFDDGNTTVTLSADQKVRIFEFGANPGNFIKAPTLSHCIDLAGSSQSFPVSYRQICFPSSNIVYALGHSPDHEQDILSKFEFSKETGDVSFKYIVLLESCIRLVLYPFSALPAIQTSHGQVLKVHESPNGLETISFLANPEKCTWLQLVSAGPEEKCQVVGLSRRNKLYVDGVLLDSFCTSFSIHNEFIVYSTVDHLARFIQLGGGFTPTPEIESYTRNLERGSKIVLSVPHDVVLVLQMPRGNLETVYPRTLLFSAIRESLANQDYRKAFVLCRKYRIDLNVLFDEDPAKLMEDIGKFVEQVQEPDFLNLFISSLKEDNILALKYPHMSKSPPKRVESKVNSVCLAIREVLQGMDTRMYSQSIITTYARQLPPNLEAILMLLKELKDNDPVFAEETLKYAIFLANVDQLFDVALGMYDFELVLMVAQLSQKDPKEYIPFLSELQSLEENYRRFRIDDYLKRHGSALENLAKSDRFDECLAYIRKNTLYASGLKLFSCDIEKHNVIMELYGNHLMDNRQYNEAGLAFMNVLNFEKAIHAFKMIGAWQNALVCAKRLAFSSDDTLSLVDDLCVYLKHHSRHLEAAKLIEAYKKDPEEVVACLLEGHYWEDAIYSCEIFSRTDLIETDVKPAVDSVKDQMLEDIQDMLDQFTKQRHRVHELQTMPPPVVPDTEDSNLDNVDVMSDATSAFTNFTVYTNYSQTTGHSSAQSLGSTKTGKSRRKMERKKNQGKKGSAFEYEYLLGSVSRLVERTNGLHADLHKVLVALVTLKLLHVAKKLQANFESLLQTLHLYLDDIYKVPEPLPGLNITTGNPTLLQNHSSPLVPKPILSASTKWNLCILSDSE